MSAAVRVEIAVVDTIVAQEVFPNIRAAQDFTAWWANHPELPTGGVTMMSTDYDDEWRGSHPLPVKLINWRQYV